MLKRSLLFGFRLVHAASRRMQRRLSGAGRILLATTVAAGALGIDTRQSLAYQAFTLGAGLLLAGLTWALLFRNPLTLRRLLPRFATMGQAFSYRLELRNSSRAMQRDLAVLDELEAQPPAPADFLRARQPGEERRNWFDRRVAYPRFAWMMRQRAGAGIPEQALPPLAPRATTSIQVAVTPLRRGYLRFARAYIARPDPLGLTRALARLPLADTLLVLPKRYRVPAIRLPGQRRHQPGGMAYAGHVGDSEEFLAVRDYRPGDPPKHIHWKSWARVGRPIVKEFQAEYFVRHALVLDTFAPEASERFEEAVSVAASLAATVQTQESLLDLMFVGRETYCYTSGPGLGGSDHLLEVLACVQPCSDQPFATLTQSVTTQGAALSGCVCVLLDWDAPRRELVARLRARGLPLLVLVVRDRGARGELPPGPMADAPERLHALDAGDIEAGLARL